MYSEQFDPAISMNELKKAIPDIKLLYRIPESDKYASRYKEYMFELTVNSNNEVVKINTFRSDFTVKEVFDELMLRLRMRENKDLRITIER